MTLSEAVKRLLMRQSLTRGQSRSVFAHLMDGQATPVQLASLLVALRMKGEVVDELSGAAEAMRAAAVPVQCKAKVIVDTCGTGGDHQGSFNVSTATAFIVAGAGYVVAKHGNRAISSQCGSADVLEELGFPLVNDPKIIEKCLHEVGIAFLFAPYFQPAMRYATPVRRELGCRTIFNLLGPLTNPAHPNVQLVGVFHPDWILPMARTLVQLGIRNGFVVHSQGHDEIVLSGKTQAAEIWSGHITLQLWSPKDFGARPRKDSLRLGSRSKQARVMLKVLRGEHNMYRDVVCANAAAAILAARRQERVSKPGLTLMEAFDIAQESLDKHRALEKFDLLRDTLRAAVKHV